MALGLRANRDCELQQASPQQSTALGSCFPLRLSWRGAAFCWQCAQHRRALGPETGQRASFSTLPRGAPQGLTATRQLLSVVLVLGGCSSEAGPVSPLSGLLRTTAQGPKMKAALKASCGWVFSARLNTEYSKPHRRRTVAATWSLRLVWPLHRLLCPQRRSLARGRPAGRFVCQAEELNVQPRIAETAALNFLMVGSASGPKLTH